MKQNGLAPILIVILIAALAVGGYLLYSSQTRPTPPPQNPVVVSQSNQPTPIPSSTPEATSSADTTNWKTYTDKEGSFTILYPEKWTQNENGGVVSFGDQRIEIDIFVWNDGSKEYTENMWESVDCGGNDPNGGCTPVQNKEVKKIVVNNNLVYFKIDGRRKMHAYIPNANKNKTVEIYSVLLTDRKLFDQILSTFKFLP